VMRALQLPAVCPAPLLAPVASVGAQFGPWPADASPSSRVARQLHSRRPVPPTRRARSQRRHCARSELQARDHEQAVLGPRRPVPGPRRVGRSAVAYTLNG
jgi:hypothetical protein